MTGLIWKDILVMRKTLRTYALFLLFYAALAVMGLFSLSVVTAMVEVIMMMLPIGAFSYDEQAKWDKYAFAMPLSRRQIVSARYGFTLIMALGSAAFGLLACVVLSFIDPTQLLVENLASVLVALGIGLFIADVLLPLCYKLGPERARPYLYLVVFLPTLLLFGAGKLGLLDSLDLSWIDSLSSVGVLGLFALVPLVALAGLAVSWLCSCRILEQKEF